MREKKILFVCMGNICRSPTGEGLMKHLVAERGLDGRIEIDSAGTISYHTGNPPDARMRAAASRRGYDLEGEARQIEPADLGHFDLIVAMDRENLAGIRELAEEHPGRARAEVKLLSDFLPPGSPPDVPDPYYGGERGFEVVLDMIEAACPAILDHLLESEA